MKVVYVFHPEGLERRPRQENSPVDGSRHARADVVGMFFVHDNTFVPRVVGF